MQGSSGRSRASNDGESEAERPGEGSGWAGRVAGDIPALALDRAGVRPFAGLPGETVGIENPHLVNVCRSEKPREGKSHDLNPKDKVVLIGSTGGIGSAYRPRVRGGGLGSSRLLHARREASTGSSLSWRGRGHAKGFVCDATKEEQVKRLVDDTLAAYGTIDIVVCNAGYEGKVCPISQQSTEEFEKVYTLNVYSPMWLMKYASPVLVEKGSGSIVSSPPLAPTRRPPRCRHTSAPSMPWRVSPSASHELGCLGHPRGNHGSRPGPVDTDMMRRIEFDTFGDTKTHEEAEKIFASTALDKRYARPEEVANAVLFLASDATAHTTGMGFNLDAIVPAH